MKNKNDEIYSRIQKLCDFKGIKVSALCLEITKSKGNLVTWKKGSIRSDHLCSIADYFDCSTDYLLGRTDNPKVNTLGEKETETILAYSNFLKAKNNTPAPDAYIAAFGGNINVPDDSIDTPPEAREALDRLDNEESKSNNSND